MKKETTKTQAIEVMQIAAIECDTLNSSDVAVYMPELRCSATLAYQDSVSCFTKGDFHNARLRALNSLQYSVGVCALSYIKALSI